ncbi:signal transduction histidine kinase/CheY-like chemotaxis protein [Pedobacter africanus]|uniref:Signal transduction histidine kinase/CheY-like chemotaxis protein n=1 Tax=Pedobacter africanus TaxID=151894 RepID=A0ACC6L552_9SPHI|nr:ATP-binding protein [Pedobacter africanus]MDR6786542.1 signal transduction histidine kinase/CheY-like chemotaxis protein [Pedobacter africanus]
MPLNATKRSPIRYYLLVFLILVLFLFAFFLYLRYNKMNALKDNVTQLVKLREDYSKVDSCIYILYQAENNSRLYAVTADREYIKKFSTQIQKVSAFLSELNINVDDDVLMPDIDRLVKQKKLKTESYLKLRKLTDSLVLGFSQLGLVEREAETALTLPKAKQQVKTITSFDTIKHDPLPGKKFFGRLADAFSGKGKQKDTSLTIIKTEKNIVVKQDVRSFNKQQIKRIQEYYKRLYANASKLKSDEKAILLLNSKLVTEIITILQTFKKNEIAYVVDGRALLGAELAADIEALDGITLVNVLLLTVLVIIILYNIIKLYKNEKVLINLGKRASQDSHSKSRFLANMSHEIRTPLNSVVGFSEQLSKSELTDEQADQVEAIRNSSEMLLALVNEILDFSKYEVGKINLENAPFMPEDEIMEVFNSMNVLAVNKNLILENKVALEKGVCLLGDRLRLKQLLMNLLTNAIKFTSSGKVTLKVHLVLHGKKHGQLKVQVEDTGIGIAPEDLGFIFDEFAQVYSSAKSRQQGTGLGLAICKKIVELQGGKINVSSTLGKGSVFSFEIPYEISKIKEHQTVVPEEPQSSHKLSGKRILLVDDNKMNVLLAQTVLKKWEMQYDCAYDGKEALDLYKKNEYDLILTDIQMPVMGGVELTHEIRYNGDFTKSTIPILGITAHVMQEDRDVYLKAGMNDLVLKPFLEQELIDKITQYI